MKLFYIYLILNLILLSKWIVDAQVCTNSDYPYKPGPSPTPSIPNRYSTRVEVNQLEDDRTYEMRAFFDSSKKKAALEIREDGLFKKLIFNYETDEIYSMKSQPTFDVPLVPPPDFQPLYPTTCETFQLSTNMSLNYYFGFTGSTTFLSPATAGTFFRLNTNNYAGEEEVRGIMCDVYASCQYNAATNSNYTLKLYFSKTNVEFPGNNASYPRVILRAKYSGAALKPDGSLKPFTNTFDYYEFRLDFERDDIFQTPGGVFCEKRKLTSIKPPKVSGGHLKFSEEIISKGVISHITDLVYDVDLQLVRYETRDRFGNDSEISYDKYPHVYVNDYTLGVSYITNKHTGKCRIETIDPFAFASDANFTQEMLNSDNGYAIRIKSPSSLLELDLDYIFTGQREIDGIMSDIFIAKSQLSKGITTINEYAFTPNDFVSQNLNQREKNIPKRLAKASPQSNFNSISTIYNFDTSEIININYFDVSQCYQKDSLVQFRLIFKPKSDIDLQILKRININQALTKNIYLALGKLSGEKSLRFSIPKITLADNGDVYVRSAILPGPEPLKLFTLFPKKLLTSTGFTLASNISSPLACALRCLQSTKCLSFDYNNNTKSCYLNEKHYSNGTFSTFTTAYDHYSRNSLNYVKFAEKYIVWSDLQLKVNSKSESFRFEVTDSNNQTFPVVLDAQLIEEVKNNENRFGSTALLSRYNLKKPNFKFSKNVGQLYKISIDECAKKCTDEIGVPCKSFHFCFLTSECLLTQETVTNDQSGYEANSYCDIYEKDSLIHYNIFRTKASINPKDKKFQNIQTPSECADKCDNELNINCKSFNFCPNTKECYLSERHLVDGSSSSNGDLVCDHYSRKYIEDFTYINTAEIPVNGEVVLKNMNSIEFCSFACVNSDGFNCKSFDYCSESKSCILNSGQKPIGSNIQNVEKDTCAHYRREYFVATSSKSKSNDSSSGTLVALSIIFAVVSVALGGIGTVFYLKKFGGRN
ncbi:unnamed protein product [Brachionus calyciflorus]|uniref:Apple domain-containing protein n=1 Tax=Brachionus calyciflorus TaxID=104777 RepID=A0A813LY00_9BILA|nr:unnamed protein product [Brachionus calyciflorus]